MYYILYKKNNPENGSLIWIRQINKSILVFVPHGKLEDYTLINKVETEEEAIRESLLYFAHKTANNGQFDLEAFGKEVGRWIVEYFKNGLWDQANIVSQIVVILPYLIREIELNGGKI
jgi:hypothetical protein